MKLEELFEARRPRVSEAFTGWKGRNQGPYKVVIEVPEFKPDGPESGRRYDIQVNWGNTQKIWPEGDGKYAISILDTLEQTKNKKEREKYEKIYSKDIKKYREFAKFINSPEAREKFFAFAKNVAAQVIASGMIGNYSTSFSYKKPPSQEDIIKGLLTAYKKYGHTEIQAYINAAKMLGYKIPDNVTSAIKKSAENTKHIEKRNELIGVIEARKQNLENAKARLKEAEDALKAHDESISGLQK